MRRYYIFASDGPPPHRCKKCAVAARFAAIFPLMADLNWTKEEQAELNRWASLMED